ncbi:MAG: diaminopimelate epimerase, partial [Clostridia bacterium]|nr:diaminopimelate epimerase [Clostridia bacterium]
YQNELYVIEVNPRSSRTIPYISKVTGVPMVDLATRAILGEKLADMGYGTGIYPNSPYVAVKVPVFSFEKLTNVDTQLGPEMKSTGEVLGIATTLEEALYKGLVAANYKMKKKGGIFISVRNQDKDEIGEIGQKFEELGYTLYATAGTAEILKSAGLDVIEVNKIHQNSKDNTLTLIESGKIDYIISTSSKGKLPTRDSVKIRRKAVERAIPCLTSIDTANAVVNSLMSRYSQYNTELIDINKLREGRSIRKFTKMQGTGNDYIYFNCIGNPIVNPEGLAVRLSDRHFGVGADGVILICDSQVADVKMRMFNADGSEGKMCGNGIRCVAKYCYDNAIVNKKQMTIETLSGIKNVEVSTQNGVAKLITVDMGKAELAPKKVPVKLEGKSVINQSVKIDGKDYDITCVSMGNPHCVVFVKNVENLNIAKIGKAFEESPLFPEGVNVEFVKVIDKRTLKMRVWERGSGETWACGTGACAVAVAAVLNGYCNKDEEISVKLLGGDLTVKYAQDDTVYMTGGAVKVYDGEVEV